MENRLEIIKAVGNGEGPNHPLEGGVIVTEGVHAGSPVEDVNVEVGEGGVVVNLGFEEDEQVLRREGGFKAGFEEVGEVGGGDCGGGGERDGGKRSAGGGGG